MNKFIITLIPTFFISLTLFSQFKAGIGTNVTSFSGDLGGYGDVKGRWGFQIGGSYVFGAEKGLYVEPGIYYVAKSTEVTDASTAAANFDAKINGIRILVAVGFSLLGEKESTVALRPFAGLSAFFLTSVGDDLEKDDLEVTNWGVFAGAGLDFSILFIDLSYEWGLNDVQKENAQASIGKSRTFYITAGIRF